MKWLVVALAAAPLVHCSDTEEDGAPDASTREDGGADGGNPDGATPDSGPDGGGASDGGADGGNPGDGGSDAGPLPTVTGACGQDGWCWDNPIPSGDSLQAVWNGGPSDVWVASGNHALRWNGQTWGLRETGLTGNPLRLSGNGREDVWLAGDSAELARWDGQTWGHVSLGQAGQVSGLSVSSGTEGWLTQAPSTEAPNGRVWRRTATGWAPADGLAGQTLSAVWSRAPWDVWALAGEQGLARWRGQGWSAAGLLPGAAASGEAYTALWVAPDADTGFAVTASGAIARWAGSGWVSLQSPRAVPLHGLWGSGANDVWFVGDLGTLLHWNGQAVSVVDAGTQEDLLAISGTGADHVWVSGARGTLLVRNASGWHKLTRDLAPAASWSVVTGSAADQVWVFGRMGTTGAALRWDGQTWRAAEAPPEPIVAAWAASPEEVWAVGTQAHRWNGKKWEAFALPEGLVARAIHGASLTEVWLVGAEGRRAVWRGRNWLDAGRSDVELHDVWMLTPGYAWAVGAKGTFENYNGADWVPITVEPAHTLRGVWGTSDENAWAVGDQGLIVHYEGIVFRVDTTSARGAALRDVWGSAADDVWAVGDGGVLLHFDGTRWQRQESGTVQGLAGAWSAGGAAWAIGEQGAVLRRR
ncbi:hypothetical protein LZ198_39785 [Myxococcus sp. K15C18031901]|uniref:hypothetical protein n=1 Tax=Myxococcus dinghuensis TaxID=2906761 RepID=UPI0020A7F2C2|nr:hypothetical protein [Myxococcus dinghuensis]MCP3105026.1 hypothetical protein [Myxococcus dinghuensis]